jgi:hypothetical protein
VLSPVPHACLGGDNLSESIMLVKNAGEPPIKEADDPSLLKRPQHIPQHSQSAQSQPPDSPPPSQPE